MKTIYLVRHGESEINVSDAFMDDREPPLTQLGREQAAYTAERAKNLSFEALVSSPFARTRETAELISQATGHKVEYSDLFVEREMPRSVYGKLKSDTAAKLTADAAVRASEGLGDKVENTETFAELKVRAEKALEYLEKRPEKSIMVVGHGFFTRMLICYMWYGKELSAEEFAPFVWGMRTKNTGITVLRHDPSDAHRAWWMLVWNDHAHLG